MAAEILRSRRDLGENLDENLGENLGENLDEFLAAEILRSRQDLVENLDEILRSRRDLAEISARSRSKFCRGSNTYRTMEYLSHFITTLVSHCDNRPT